MTDGVIDCGKGFPSLDLVHPLCYVTPALIYESILAPVILLHLPHDLGNYIVAIGRHSYTHAHTLSTPHSHL